MVRFSQAFQVIFLMGALTCTKSASVQLFAQGPQETRVLVCESSDDSCSKPNARFGITWIFNGTEGKSVTGGKETGALLSIQKFDSGSLIIRRFDQTGPSAGLAAVYTGSVDGLKIIGKVHWSWPNHPNYPADGFFSAVLQDAPAAPMKSPVAADSPAKRPQ